jgi:glycosyltransferase involved in cell wall biosynthesis
MDVSQNQRTGMPMKLVVIVPTVGRKESVTRTLRHLERQTRPPDEVVVSAPDSSHVESFSATCYPVSYAFGKKGLCAQRNQALEKVLGRFDIVTFFDDDFLAATTYLERLLDAFRTHPDWAVVHGNVVKDGVHGPGLSFEEGLRALECAEAAPAGAPVVTNHTGAYGCNMSMRTEQIGALRFDERLVLYGWQEDIDFTSQLRRFGRIVRLSTLVGVHLGAKGGRLSGVRHGYSQIVNPVYLLRKGTMPVSFAFDLMASNFAANVAKSLWSEPYVDRRGRLKGNLLAAYHLLRGRIEPEHVLKL